MLERVAQNISSCLSCTNPAVDASRHGTGLKISSGLIRVCSTVHLSLKLPVCAARLYFESWLFCAGNLRDAVLGPLSPGWDRGEELCNPSTPVTYPLYFSALLALLAGKIVVELRAAPADPVYTLYIRKLSQALRAVSTQLAASAALPA